MQAENAARHLLLIGGGHSHLYVLKHFAAVLHNTLNNSRNDIKVTLISKHAHALYSGMIPGVIAGHYHSQQTKIDLKNLCNQGHIEFIEDTFKGLDTERQIARCASGKSLSYDWLSLNLGSEPDLSHVSGADQVGFAVKPIDRLLEQWQGLSDRLAQQKDPHLCLVGGGAAGVEVALAMYSALLRRQHTPVRITLVCATPTLLPSHNHRVQRTLSKQLDQRRINVLYDQKVTTAHGTPGDYTLTLENQAPLHCSEVIWAVQAAGKPWLKDTGLSCTDAGFIRVNRYLQSLSHDNVFAAGDLAHFESAPLAKSGVYAVRQGQPLAENLQRIITGQPLRAYRPQQHFLSLLSLGNKHAIASRGSLCLSGRWVWWWKDAIDRHFIRQFQEFRP